MIELKLYNANPKKRKTSDCVIRALSVASGKDYEVVFKELVEIAIKTGYMVNEKHCYEKWLENNGFMKMAQPRHSDGTKYLVGDVDKLLHFNEYKCVVSMANHVSCVVDNKLIDIWDCRRKSISNYYVKKLEPKDVTRVNGLESNAKPKRAKRILL